MKGKKATKNMTSVSISEVEYRILCKDINARISDNQEISMKERSKILGPKSRNYVPGLKTMYKSNYKTTINDVLPHQRFTLEKVDEKKNEFSSDLDHTSSPKVNL